MNGSLTLSDYPRPMVRLFCSNCDRRGQYRKATLIERYGADIRLPDLLREVSGDCPDRDRRSCGIHFDGLV